MGDSSGALYSAVLWHPLPQVPGWQVSHHSWQQKTYDLSHHLKRLQTEFGFLALSTTPWLRGQRFTVLGYSQVSQPIGIRFHNCFCMPRIEENWTGSLSSMLRKLREEEN